MEVPLQHSLLVIGRLVVYLRQRLSPPIVMVIVLEARLLGS